MQRKDRVLEALRSLCTHRPAQSSALRRHTGFSAEEVAEQAAIDRTNASRDLNLLAQEGIIERIPGRPVLFHIKAATQDANQEIAPSSNGKKSHTPSALVSTAEESKAAQQLSISASVTFGSVVTSFETLIGSSEGLKVAIQQAKAAILYPPRGLHTLTCGPSGVGKTTFARLMHAFALEQKTLPANAPFISFNCADYAGNPQLLMAHLFGVVRGAYTGAERDRVGLVEQADHGILFLDEVHRLPPEGQEMLFYLMDSERFRRMGEVKERHTSLLLLAATTEDPHSALLPTFRRRIPMTITLPGLTERTMAERYELLRAFFTNECSTIGTNIHVAPQVLRALLVYECPGNIGQLRTDVQLTCARAYLEYRTNNLPELHIHTNVLPEHIRRGLLRTGVLHRALSAVQHLIEATHIFTPTGLSLDNHSASTSSQNLYEIISTELNVLRGSGISEYEINRLLHLDIQHYFQGFADTVTQEQAEGIAHLVDEHILTVSRSITQFAEKQLRHTFPEKLAFVLALHLSSALEHIANGHQLAAPAIPSMHKTNPLEYEIAHMALLRIRSELGISLPESEADVLAILFANADVFLYNEQATVGIVVAAHGHGIASGLAELANTLVGVELVHSIALTLEQTPEELLEQVEHCVSQADQGSGVLLLVDFSSLLSLGELVTRRLGIPIRAISGVCAPLVVEALRRAQHSKHMNLDQLAASLTSISHTEDSSKASASLSQQNGQHGPLNPSAVQSERVILSVCLTGFGSASKLADLLQEHLPELGRQNIEIICMDINLSRKTEADIQQLIGQKRVIAVVGTINPHLENYPFISLTELLFGDGIARMRTLTGGTLIDPELLQPPAAALQTSTTPPPTFTQRADLVQEISHTLSQRLLFLNPIRILPLLESMIEMIEVEVGESFPIDVLAGLLLHLACVLEREPQQSFLVSQSVRQAVEQQYARELAVCRQAWQTLGIQLAHTLPDEEAYNIVGILRQVDIFSL